MAEQQVDDSLLKIDRWSKVAAIFVALGMYVAGIVLTGDYSFAAIIAAFVGIGVRIYAPYYASRRASDSAGSDLEDIASTGNYHHGAVGIALVVGPIVTLVIGLIEPDNNIAYAAGAFFTVLTFTVLRVALPK
ncbi:hypothetical protein BRC66_00875 [Halobacteriales archaeon QH_2_66_30]|jgi:hypothetical protein|nr:MAG: hypothetical protein BRC66_00875 [Halobacteriales archaeon QH_2_66_30]